MLGKHSFVRVAENIWEIPSTFRDDMRVPARVYADEDLLAAALGDNSVVQLVNTATLPGVIKHAIAMPDIHQGYGFPIGGVVATHLAASLLTHMHAYDDAIAEYKKAIVMDPGFALAHSNLGNAYQQKGDMASAIRGLMVRPLPVEPVRTRSS